MADEKTEVSMKTEVRENSEREKKARKKETRPTPISRVQDKNN